MLHWFLSLNDATKGLLTAALTLVTAVLAGIGWFIKRLLDKKDSQADKNQTIEQKGLINKIDKITTNFK